MERCDGELHERRLTTSPNKTNVMQEPLENVWIGWQPQTPNQTDKARKRFKFKKQILQKIRIGDWGVVPLETNKAGAAAVFSYEPLLHHSSHGQYVWPKSNYTARTLINQKSTCQIIWTSTRRQLWLSKFMQQQNQQHGNQTWQVKKMTQTSCIIINWLGSRKLSFCEQMT